MRRDGVLITQILEAFEAHSEYASTAPVDCYHIDLLDRAGYVIARIERDAQTNRAVKASIEMITYKGYDALDRMREDASNAKKPDKWARNEDGLTELEQREVDLAFKNMCEGDRRYETIMWGMVSGSISISLYACKWLVDSGKIELRKLWPLAGIIFIFALAIIIMLVSHRFSIIAHDLMIKKIYRGDRRAAWKNWARSATSIANWTTLVLFSGGLICLAVFILKFILN